MVGEFHYRLPWRATGARPGHHAGRRSGGGFEFLGHAPLIRAPDPRRFDLRATLADPWGQVMVRLNSQHTAVPVYTLADLSASMNFDGYASKPEQLAAFVASAGYSAYRTGDPFAFFGCGETLIDALVQPLTRAKAAGHGMSLRLRAHSPTASGATGLLDASGLIRQRGLVFLLSDFHLPARLIERLLMDLATHTVVPVVLWDRAEHRLPAFGIARLTDPETGTRRTLWLRPALRERVRLAFARRRAWLQRLFAANGARALFLEERFEPDQVTRYFYG